MVYNNVIQGKYVHLVSVSEKDAEFTLRVRQDPKLTRYLPKVNNTLEQQRKWIQAQRERAGDYYFVAKDCNDRSVGTIGIYDINGKIGEGGRLTSIGNALQSIEIQYLILLFDFNVLLLDEVTTFVYAENISAIKLSEKFGIRFQIPELDDKGRTVCYGHITRDDFQCAEPDIRKMIYRKKINNSEE